MIIAVVHWIDAYSIDEWGSIKEVERADNYKCITVGMLMHEDKDRVIIAHTTGGENDSCGNIVIPKCSIKAFNKRKVML